MTDPPIGVKKLEDYDWLRMGQSGCGLNPGKSAEAHAVENMHGAFLQGNIP